MIVFSIDETGNFEHNEISDTRCSFIGGFAFQPDGGDDPGYVHYERKRIAAFLRAECESVEGARYPEDLHLEKKGRNRTRTNAVKEKILADLPLFLNGKSIPNIEPGRLRGKYYLFGITVDADNSPISRSAESG